MVSSSDLKQLYVKKHTAWYSKNNKETFEVRAITKSGRNQKLVGGLSSQEQGIFIEQKIEKLLNIKPAAVPGEVEGQRRPVSLRFAFYSAASL